MLRFREWLDARPLWQFVLVQLALSTAMLVGELLYRLTHSGFERLSPVFYVIWLVFMTPVYIWLGRRRGA